MRNLLVYINPAKKFDQEQGVLVRIQIENNLELGWKKKDILLVTNFDYKYQGIKSLVVDDNLYYPWDKTSCKMPVISYLLNKNILGKEAYWYHDLDVYQLCPVQEPKFVSLGLTSYCYRDQWQCGSFFFKKKAKDVFQMLTDYMYYKQKGNRADERLLTRLTKRGSIGQEKYTVLNVTYNFTYKHTDYLYKRAEKPIKAIHFNPWEIDPGAYNPQVLHIMMYGKNELGIPLMNKRLIKLFNKHGLK